VIYYIKEGQSSIFSKVNIKGNECEISKINKNNKKAERIVKKLKKKNINKIVISKKLKENQQMIKQFNNYDITIFDGKWLMKYLLGEIIEYIGQIQKLQPIDEIAILSNDLSDEVKNNIINFSNKYKKIRIVTNHIEKFKKLEQEIYDKYGVSIIITNNKRKALAKSILIINFDFVQETINQFNINENAIIINLEEKIKINKKRYNGLIITDYGVELDKNKLDLSNLKEILKKQDEFYLKEILEERIYTLSKTQPSFKAFATIRNIIKENNIKVRQIYGANGSISWNKNIYKKTKKHCFSYKNII